MDSEVQRKILLGHIARVQRRVKKIMKEQMDILKQVYKLDNRIDKVTWQLTQQPDNSQLQSEKLSLEVKLSKLMQRKYQNNDLLRVQEEKSLMYTKKLTDLETSLLQVA